MLFNKTKLASIIAGLLAFSVVAESVASDEVSRVSEIPITLKGLVFEASKRNANAIYQQLQWEISHQQESYERGIFEPVVSLSLEHDDIHEPNTVEESLSRSYQTEYTAKTTSHGLSISGLLSTGTEWSLAYTGDQSESNIIDLDSDNESGKEYENGLQLTLVQPLLKGFGSKATKAKIWMAQAEQEVAFEGYRYRMMEVAGTAIKAYWNLYGAHQMVLNWQDSLDMAEKVLTDVKSRVKRGKLPRTEVLEAQTGVSLRAAELKKAEANLVESQNQIYTLLNLSVNIENPVTLSAVDDPEQGKVLDVDFANTVDTALKNWPPYLMAQAKLKRESFQVDYSKNQAKPELDLTLTYSTTTLDDHSVGIGDAFDNEYDSWYGGLEFSMPIFGGQSSKSEVQIARIKKRQAAIEINSAKRQLVNNLNSKIQRLQATQNAVAAHRQDVKFKKQLLDIEIKRFESGKSSIREVMRQEEDLLNFQRRYLSNIVQLKLAEATFALAEGTLLAKYEIEINRADEDTEYFDTKDDILQIGALPAK